MGKSASRWTKREGKSFSRLKIDFGFARSTNSSPTSSAKARRAVSSAEEAELDGGLVEAHALGLGRPRLLQLRGIQQPFAESISPTSIE